MRIYRTYIAIINADIVKQQRISAIIKHIQQYNQTFGLNINTNHFI